MARPGIQEGQAFIKAMWGLENRNVVMIDIEASKCKKLQSPTKHNELDACQILDMLQGRQRKYMVVGLTVTSVIGFLKEGSRINVAVTRNQDCLVVVANIRALDQLSSFQNC